MKRAAHASQQTLFDRIFRRSENTRSSSHIEKLWPRFVPAQNMRPGLVGSTKACRLFVTLLEFVDVGWQAPP
jgi:hypothetical protein